MGGQDCRYHLFWADVIMASAKVRLLHCSHEATQTCLTPSILIPRHYFIPTKPLHHELPYAVHTRRYHNARRSAVPRTARSKQGTLSLLLAPLGVHSHTRILEHANLGGRHLHKLIRLHVTATSMIPTSERKCTPRSVMYIPRSNRQVQNKYIVS